MVIVNIYYLIKFIPLLNDVNITTSIPRNLISVSFKGTTGKNACARQFVVDWINSIIKWGTEDWNQNVNNI